MASINDKRITWECNPWNNGITISDGTSTSIRKLQDTYISDNTATNAICYDGNYIVNSSVIKPSYGTLLVFIPKYSDFNPNKITDDICVFIGDISAIYYKGNLFTNNGVEKKYSPNTLTVTYNFEDFMI